MVLIPSQTGKRSNNCKSQPDGITLGLNPFSNRETFKRLAMQLAVEEKVLIPSQTGKRSNVVGVLADSDTLS